MEFLFFERSIVMKAKWIYLVVAVVVVWLMGLFTYNMVISPGSSTYRQRRALEKDNRYLRVLAENRELRWTIIVHETKLRKAARRAQPTPAIPAPAPEVPKPAKAEPKEEEKPEK
jgi:hypothetical protein